MILRPAPDDVRNAMFHRLVSETGIIEMGVYPVMFGYRVRAGFCGYGAVELDWCAGDDWENVERLYSICRSILLKRPEDRSCFDRLPRCSRIKPFFNDHDFVATVLREAVDVEVVKLKAAP